MLTKEDLTILQRPFAANEHEFLKGKAYITEGAITDRIEMIDPSWKLEQISLFNRVESNQVVCTMRLTIKDVWRDGVGMSQITKLKSGDGEANEAEKSAATDALKRAARLFGIGRYLLDLPGYVVDVKTMGEYLGGYSATPTPTAPKNPFNAALPATPAPSPANGDKPLETQRGAIAGQPDDLLAWFGKPVIDCWGMVKTYALEKFYSKVSNHMKNSFQQYGISADKDAMYPSDTWAQKPAGELVKFLQTRHEQPEKAAS